MAVIESTKSGAKQGRRVRREAEGRFLTARSLDEHGAVTGYSLMLIDNSGEGRTFQVHLSPEEAKAIGLRLTED